MFHGKHYNKEASKIQPFTSFENIILISCMINFGSSLNLRLIMHIQTGGKTLGYETSGNLSLDSLNLSIIVKIINYHVHIFFFFQDVRSTSVLLAGIKSLKSV